MFAKRRDHDDREPFRGLVYGLILALPVWVGLMGLIALVMVLVN